MKKFFNKTKKGVTLTELLVGVAIIALALIPMISSLISGMKTTTASNMEVNAALIGSSVFEAMVNTLNFDEIVESMNLDLFAGVSDEDGSSSNNEIKYNGTTYKLKLSVVPLKNSQIKIKFRQARAGLFGKTVYKNKQKTSYAKKGLDVKSQIERSWKNFKQLNLFLSSFRVPKPSLKEIFLEIRWVDPKGLERVYNFYTRKARLSSQAKP